MMKSVTLFNLSDVKKFTVIDGVLNNIKIKRKYGKHFKRPIFKIDAE